MPLEKQWTLIRRTFGAAFASSLHFSIATVSPDGMPHVAPIGSILLLEPGTGVYFEEYPTRMPSHFDENPHVCILGVNSSRWFWLRALLRGRFEKPPAVRLFGTVGVRRPASRHEIDRWQRRIRPVRFTKGHRLMWSNMRMVRELHFTDADIVNLGAMTEQLHRQVVGEQDG